MASAYYVTQKPGLHVILISYSDTMFSLVLYHIVTFKIIALDIAVSTVIRYHTGALPYKRIAVNKHL